MHEHLFRCCHRVQPEHDAPPLVVQQLRCETRLVLEHHELFSNLQTQGSRSKGRKSEGVASRDRCVWKSVDDAPRLRARRRLPHAQERDPIARTACTDNANPTSEKREPSSRNSCTRYDKTHRPESPDALQVSEIGIRKTFFIAYLATSSSVCPAPAAAECTDVSNDAVGAKDTHTISREQRWHVRTKGIVAVAVGAVKVRHVLDHGCCLHLEILKHRDPLLHVHKAAARPSHRTPQASVDLTLSPIHPQRPRLPIALGT